MRELALLCALAPTFVLGTETSGIEIKRENAGIMLGVESDVSLARSGDGALTIAADVTVSGELTLSDGTTMTDLLALVADLQLQIDDLQSQVDANAQAVADAVEDVSSNADDIASLQDSVALLDATVNVYAEQVVYESDFDFSYTEWVFDGADLQTTECDGVVAVGGNLGEGDSATLYLEDLPAHSKMNIQFTYVAIDTWDGETAHCNIDGTEVWTEDFVGTDGTDVCAGSGGDTLLQVESIELQHFSQGATVEFTSTINQEADDETWGIADVTVTTELEREYSLAYASEFAENGAAGWQFFGGADAEVSTCGDFTLLGGYDVLANSHSVVKTISNINEHTALTVSFEFVKIDTWDGEVGKLFVDDKLVWSATPAGGSSNICGGTVSDSINTVTVEVPHSSDIAKLRFTSTLDQGATDESWGVKSLNVFAHTPSVLTVYATNFEEGAGDWTITNADAVVTTCGDYTVLGGYEAFGVDAAAELFLSGLSAHSEMTISFDFVKLDSWDTEDAFIYIDDELVWQRTFGGDGENVCGRTDSGWNEYFVPVSFTFPHHAQGVKVYVTTSLSSAATDESWGLANFKITTKLEEGIEAVYESDFASDLQEGWSIEGAVLDNVTTCNDEVLLGGYGNFGTGAVASTIVDLSEQAADGGSGVIVAFTFLQIDSWDAENAYLYANDVVVWSETLSTAGTQLCGRSDSGWNELKIVREIDLGWVTDDELELRFTSDLSSAPTDESWGLADVDVYTYPAADAVAYEADFALDGDEGWIITGSDGGTTECNGEVLLGGYENFDISDYAQYLAELPLHTSMQVDFTFVKIDSWDTETASFYIDHDVMWEETYSGSSGSQQCGSSNSGWNEEFVEVSVTVDHFSPFSWLQWTTDLSGAGDDESWGLNAVKVSTFMDSTYTPVYQSRFHFQELDGWVVDWLDGNADGYFTECGGITVFGGYLTFAKDTVASRTITDMPTHAQVTIGVTWAKIDSWDSENFYITADSNNVYTSGDLSASAGDPLCGTTNSGWDEAFYTVTETFDHTDTTLDLSFYTDLSSDGTDESWGLVGVNVYVS